MVCHIIDDEGAFIEAKSAVEFINICFDYNSHFNWKQEHKLFESLEIRNNLLNKYADFKTVIASEENFYDITRKLSIAQKYLQIRDYTNAMQQMQKFMEAYLKAVDAGMKNGKHVIKIKDQMNIALSDSARLVLPIHKKVIDSFDICFDDINNPQRLHSMDKDYLPINDPRNKLMHAGKGMGKDDFNKKLGYITKEIFGAEDTSNFLNKWIEWFGLPKTNIFESMNKQVIKFLKNPDTEN